MTPPEEPATHLRDAAVLDLPGNLPDSLAGFGRGSGWPTNRGWVSRDAASVGMERTLSLWLALREKRKLEVTGNLPGARAEAPGRHQPDYKREAWMPQHHIEEGKKDHNSATHHPAVFRSRPLFPVLI
jgi:hypothetical protein